MCAKAVALAARPEGMPKTSDFQNLRFSEMVEYA